MHERTVDDNNQPYRSRDLADELLANIRIFADGNGTTGRWIVMPGLRGVGKSTLMAQLYCQINSEYGSRVDQLYLSLDNIVDNFSSDLYEALETYQMTSGNDFYNLKRPLVLYLDEVQADPKWARTLKTIYDTTRNIFFICTGSAAVNLQMDADTAGRRAITKRMYPLSYTEYQLLHSGVETDKELSKTIYDTVYNSSSAREVYAKLASLQPKVAQTWAHNDRRSIADYLMRGSLTFAMNDNMRPSYAYEAIRQAVDKVISLDIQTLERFNADSIPAMRMIMQCLSESHDYITLDNLCRLTGVSKPKVVNMMDALTKAELIVKIPAYGNNVTKSRNPSRYNFMSPAIRAAYYDLLAAEETKRTHMGVLFEDYVVLHLMRTMVNPGKASIYHPYAKTGGQCDFILRTMSGQIAIELGYGQKGKGYKQIQNTIKQQNLDCKYGIIYSDNNLYLNDNVVTVPIDYLMLM